MLGPVPLPSSTSKEPTVVTKLPLMVFDSEAPDAEALFAIILAVNCKVFSAVLWDSFDGNQSQNCVKGNICVLEPTVCCVQFIDHFLCEDSKKIRCFVKWKIWGDVGSTNLFNKIPLLKEYQRFPRSPLIAFESVYWVAKVPNSCTFYTIRRFDSSSENNGSESTRIVMEEEESLNLCAFTKCTEDPVDELSAYWNFWLLLMADTTARYESAQKTVEMQKGRIVVRRLTVGPTSQYKPARDSNPESSDMLLSSCFEGIYLSI